MVVYRLLTCIIILLECVFISYLFVRLMGADPFDESLKEKCPMLYDILPLLVIIAIVTMPWMFSSIEGFIACVLIWVPNIILSIIYCSSDGDEGNDPTK